MSATGNPLVYRKREEVVRIYRNPWSALFRIDGQDLMESVVRIDRNMPTDLRVRKSRENLASQEHPRGSERFVCDRDSRHSMPKNVVCEAHDGVGATRDPGRANRRPELPGFIRGETQRTSTETRLTIYHLRPGQNPEVLSWPKFSEIVQIAQKKTSRFDDVFLGCLSNENGKPPNDPGKTL